MKPPPSNWINRLLPERIRLISRLAGANFLVNAVTLLAAPLLAKLYSPDEYGVFALVVSMATVGSVFATLSIHQAINAARDREDTAAILRLSCRFALAWGALAGAACAVGLFWGLPLSHAMIAPLIVVYALTRALGVWMTREGAFSVLIKTRLATALIAVLATILGYKAGAMGLIGGQFLGAAAGCIKLRSAFKDAAPPRTPDDLRLAWARHSRFSLLRLSSDLLNSTVSQIPLWTIGHVFGATIAGQYAMMNRVFSAPTSWVGNAIGEVFTREAGSAYRSRRECRAEFALYARKLAWCAALLTLPIIVAGPALFGLVFGPQWADAGQLARLLSGWYFLRLAISPLTNLLVIGDRPGLNLILQCLLAIGFGATAAWTALEESLHVLALGLTATAILFYGLNFFFVRRIASGEPPSPLP